jgi:hypothetical protein
MKIKTCLIFTLLAAVALSLPVYAHDESEEMKMGMMEEKGSEGKGMMGGKRMDMHQMMMKKMMEKSVVATSDGGIVIVTANKITKYDKDLNLVKEVETKMDMESMKEMMGKCPMMKGGMKGMDDQTMASSTTVTSAVNAEDHAAHH